MSPAVIQSLSSTFSDPDYLETYQFSRLHEIILGLRHGTIEDGLAGDSSCINCADSRQNTPLLWAARRGNLDDIKKLLQCGADLTVKNAAGEDALIETVFFGKFECMQALLAAGAPVTQAGDGKSILHHACKLRDDIAYVKRILRTGTDINMRDSIQRTPLALASIPNHFRPAKYLLDHGADIEAKDAFGATPLLRAVHYGSVETATLLLDYGADVKVVDIDGWTILHRAALSSDKSMIRLLASRDLSGVDAEAKDNSNKTAFEHLVELNPCTEMLVTFTALLNSIKQASAIEGEGDLDDSSTESSL